MHSYQIETLRQLIGTRLLYHGQPYQIIEILEDGPSMVLQLLSRETMIQPDQHGDAHRRVPETAVISIFSAEGGEFSTEFLNLDLPS